MTNKKRLEEIKLKFNNTIDTMLYVPYEDVKFLIEQAERVQELEQQNKRYREALEFYANEETYEMKFATDTDEICVPLTVIELDEGKKAREALEG